MQLKTPMKAIKENLLLTRKGDVFAYYRIKSQSIPMQNKDVVTGYKTRWRRFFEEVTKYEDFHLSMYPQDYQLEARFGELEADIAMDAEDLAGYYNTEAVRILKARLGQLTKYDFLVGIKLKTSAISLDANLKENIQSVLATTTDTLLNVFGMERNKTDQFFAQYDEVEDSLAQVMASVQGQRITEDDLIYFNRYNFIRGLEHEVGVEQENNTVGAITNTVIDPTQMDTLRLSSNFETGFTTFLVVDEFLDNMAESDLFYEAQSLPFTVEVNMKVHAESKSVTKASLGMKKTQLRETEKEQNLSGDHADKSVVRSEQMIRGLQEDIKEDNINMMNWLATIVITGESKRECQRKANIVRRHLKGAGIKCQVPAADQLYLFYKMLPGAVLEATDKNWIQKTIQDGLGECCFGVNAEVGSKIGFHIGWIDRFNEHTDLESAIQSSRDFVLYHPFMANRQIKGSKTRSPHVLITGDTGNGKSYLAKMLFLYISMLDVKSLYIDPKKEMRKWIRKIIKNREIREEYPLFVAHLEKLHYVTLDAREPENWGALDPIVLLPSMEAKELLQVVFQQVYDFKGKDVVHTAFLKAITSVIERKQAGEQVGSVQVIETMATSENKAVQEAAAFLHEIVADSILKLVIHDGSNPALSLTERISIIEIENLDLPEATDEFASYTDSQLKSCAIMFCLGKFCELFGQNKDEKTLEFIDEAWMITASPQGKKVEKSMRRVGRSYDNALYFISQSTKDALTEEDSGNFGMAFAFDEPNERQSVLRWMNMETTKENEDMLESMFQGQCLFKDYYGRTAKISVECLFSEWEGALATIEKSSVAYAEERYL
ncbi:ATP-binding protein [Listeria booriae]|uniref:ATP-binding protein n=1 Tax=Listeria booriae TaxID=1552123 RepID=UPI001627B589|nr:hypothetical protein [Listeria booriae]